MNLLYSKVLIVKGDSVTHSDIVCEMKESSYSSEPVTTKYHQTVGFICL